METSSRRLLQIDAWRGRVDWTSYIPSGGLVERSGDHAAQRWWWEEGRSAWRALPT